MPIGDKQMWGSPTTSFPVMDDWIDSPVAADIMMREPLLAGMSDHYSVFLLLRMVEVQRAGAVIESRYRHRLHGCGAWVDQISK
jgi:hypothetical protein